MLYLHAVGIRIADSCNLNNPYDLTVSFLSTSFKFTVKIIPVLTREKVQVNAHLKGVKRILQFTRVEVGMKGEVRNLIKRVLRREC